MLTRKLFSFLFIFAFVFLCLNIQVYAQNQELNKKAQYICAIVLNNKPLDYKKNFSTGFVNSLPESYFSSLAKDLIDSIGTCLQFKEILADAHGGEFHFLSKTGRYARIEISIDQDNLINSLFVKEVVLPDVLIDSWNAADAYARSLKGHTSLTIENFDQTSKAEKAGSELQPLGSGFKLYVLGALVDSVKSGHRNWHQSFPLRSEWKSLPSGEMQDWENGTEIELKTYAEYMIKPPYQYLRPQDC